ncbi:MAG: hypothetical protein CMP91_11450 [Gammaproteobacteria bacterium]|nr:hypothetical protein [Gammaproteobacteria bacterium]
MTLFPRQHYLKTGLSTLIQLPRACQQNFAALKRGHITALLSVKIIIRLKSQTAMAIRYF